MRRLTLVVLLAGAAIFALELSCSRSPESRRADHPAARDAALAAILPEIEAGRQTTPIMGEPAANGGTTVTFLARRAGGLAPRIVSDVTGWGEHTDGTFDFTAGTMTRVGQTEWYALETTVAAGARIEYLIAYAPTDYRIDPHNPRQAAGPTTRRRARLRVRDARIPDARRVCRRRQHRPPARSPRPASRASGLARQAGVLVYTPAGYRRDGAYPLAVFLDLRSGQISRVLDWLIASQAIEPIVAVFVGPQARGHAYPEPAALRAFLTDELLTWLAPRYAVTRSAERRAVIAISFGGKDALDAALSCDAAAGTSAMAPCRNDPFGRLGLLVPGRRITRADIAAVAAAAQPSLHVAILAGRYDRANVETARGLRQALVDAGHRVDYTEVPEGHSAVTWTYHLDAVLVGLFGPASR